MGWIVGERAIAPTLPQHIGGALNYVTAYKAGNREPFLTGSFSEIPLWLRPADVPIEEGPPPTAGIDEKTQYLNQVYAPALRGIFDPRIHALLQQPLKVMVEEILAFEDVQFLELNERTQAPNATRLVEMALDAEIISAEPDGARFLRAASLFDARFSQAEHLRKWALPSAGTAAVLAGAFGLVSAITGNPTWAGVAAGSVFTSLCAPITIGYYSLNFMRRHLVADLRNV